MQDGEAMLLHIPERTRSYQGNAMVELCLLLPLLLLLIFGTAEISNMLNSTTTLNHLTRESANVVSRQLGNRGSSTWADSLNADLVTVIDTAVPVINRTGSGATGPNQFRIIYTEIEWNPAAAICDYNLDHNLGIACQGNIASGQPDYYRIRRSNSGWSGNVTWQYGSLSATSQLGNDGDCACKRLSEVKQLTSQGLTLYAIELFYDYRPGRITSLQYLVGTWASSVLYRRSLFLDRT